MKLSDKHCYPFVGKSLQNPNCEEEIFFEGNGGLTFRERLIIALASNPYFFETDCDEAITFTEGARNISSQADAILKELEK